MKDEYGAGLNQSRKLDGILIAFKFEFTKNLRAEFEFNKLLIFHFAC